VWYFEPAEFPHENKLSGRWIGFAHRIGQALCFWILPSSGIPIARTTIQEVSNEEQLTETFQSRLKEFDRVLEEKLNEASQESIPFHLYREDEDQDDDWDSDPLAEPEATNDNVENIENDIYDELLLTEPLLNIDGEITHAKIIGRKRDDQGNLIGQYNHNPYLNTKVYLAHFQTDISQNTAPIS